MAYAIDTACWLLNFAGFTLTLFDSKPANACPAFLNLQLADSPQAKAGREHCEDLWKDFSALADHHFLSQFPLHLHQRWFEMYLTVVLIRAGYAVECPKPGPDILLTINGKRIWIEAVCSTSGESEKVDTVPELKFNQSVATKRPTNEMTLRIANSLQAKQEKFQNWIKMGIVDPNDLTVIAINIHGIPWAWVDIHDLMCRALYGLGNILLTIDKNSNSVVGQGHQHQPEIIKKGSGKPVCTQPFVDKTLKHISAVLGSWEDSCNLSQNFGEGLILYPNVSAVNIWPPETIKLGEEWVPKYDKNDNLDLNKIEHPIINTTPQPD